MRIHFSPVSFGLICKYDKYSCFVLIDLHIAHLTKKKIGQINFIQTLKKGAIDGYGEAFVSYKSNPIIIR